MSDSPKRRWYQFSLRALLLFVLVASASVGWVGSGVIQRAREAQKEREKLRDLIRGAELQIITQTKRPLAESYDAVDWKNVFVTGPPPQFDANGKCVSAGLALDGTLRFRFIHIGEYQQKLPRCDILP